MKRLFSAGIVLLFLFAAVILQGAYDARERSQPRTQSSFSSHTAKAFDLGLHSALASYLWLETRTQLPFLPEGPEAFSQNLRLINELDPKFNTPYIFTLIVLPTVQKFPDRIQTAIEIGEHAMRQADPDWRIPFYLAAVYHLELNDRVNATKYFDLAARAPGIPETVRRFAINYGIYPHLRAQTVAIWEAIYQSAQDDATRERARAYIAHFEILNLLDRAVARYFEQVGTYPAILDEVVRAGILKEIPKDPLGLEFILYEGGQVGNAPVEPE